MNLPRVRPELYRSLDSFPLADGGVSALNDLPRPCRPQVPTRPCRVMHGTFFYLTRYNCMGGSSAPKNTTTTTKTELPPFLQNAYQ